MANTQGQLKVYRMKIIDFYDPDRPSWAQTSVVSLADHPQTKVGYLTKHFYSDSVSLNDTLPTWTYGTITSNSLDSSTWNAASGVMPPNSGPIPNTQGVYFNQIVSLNDPLNALNVGLQDIDVLRFWTAGRPNAYGGMPPYVEKESEEYYGGATVIEIGQTLNISSDANSWFTFSYIDGWLNDLKFLPLTVPSYLQSTGELYSRVPELGPWRDGIRDIGITGWNWTSHSITKKYGKFCNKWHQNRDAEDFRNYLPEHPFGMELTYQKQCGYDGSAVAPSSNDQGLSIVTSSGDATDAGEANLFLLDTMWDGTYYTGGFEIENRGLAYHLRNAVKWNNLGTAPSIGNIKQNIFYDGDINIIDGNAGPIPPTMTFAGAGGSWASSLKTVAPYNSYLDYDEETGNLTQYYSNTGKFLKCSFIDFPLNPPVLVAKPKDLWISDGTSQRVCPEYSINDEIIAARISSPYLVGANSHDIDSEAIVEYVELNASARKLIDYSTMGTLEPYYDYFPDTYIPFETSFLLPSGQKINPYSFNCSKYTYSDKIGIGVSGAQGSKGDKGPTLGSSTAGDKGEKGTGGGAGVAGSDGEKGILGNAGAGGGVGADGAVGAAGDAGDKGSKGNQGNEGDSPAGDAGENGTGILTGYVVGHPTWGTINAEKSNYTTSTAGPIRQVIGTADPSAVNSSSTVLFTSKLFGVCVENSSTSAPEYEGMYMYASDFIDNAR